MNTTLSSLLAIYLYNSSKLTYELSATEGFPQAVTLYRNMNKDWISLLSTLIWGFASGAVPGEPAVEAAQQQSEERSISSLPANFFDHPQHSGDRQVSTVIKFWSCMLQVID